MSEKDPFLGSRHHNIQEIA